MSQNQYDIFKLSIFLVLENQSWVPPLYKRRYPVLSDLAPLADFRHRSWAEVTAAAAAAAAAARNIWNVCWKYQTLKPTHPNFVANSCRGGVRVGKAVRLALHAMSSEL